jgi:type I restriction enzyme S subunit
MAHNYELFFDALERTIDNRGKTPPLSTSGYPLIEVKHIQDGHIYPVFEDTKFVDQETWDTWFRAHLKPGDIIFSTVGSIARSCIVPEKPKFCIAQNVLGFRVNQKKADPRFIYYAINGTFFLHEVHGRTVETVQKSIKVYDLKTCRIPLPPLADQKAIASVLGALDDKIELNRQTRHSLERVTRAIFNAWFVEFDPVKAKVAGASSFPSVSQEAFDALPTRFVESELGTVPEGWGVGEMGDIGRQRREPVAPEDAPEGTAYIGLEHMPRRCISLTDWGTADTVTSGKSRFSNGDILFGKLRPYFHKVGPAPVDGVCSTDIVVLFAKKIDWAAWLLMVVSSDEFVSHANQTSAGTKMPRTNWKDMAGFPVVLPPSDMLGAFQQIAAPMLDLIRQSIYESHNLAALRDYLLPKLMRGEVSVAGAERTTL